MTDPAHRGLLPLLTAAMGVGPLLTYGLSAMSVLVIESMTITAAQFGLLATSTFLTAAALSLIFGRLSDRFPARTLLVTMFAAAAVSYIVAAVSTNYLWLLVSMVLSGGAQALSNPVTNRVISEHVSTAKRSVWIGVKQSGVQASQLLAGVGCPALALLWGWRGALWVGAALAGLMCIFAWRCAPAHARSPRKPAGDPDPQRAESGQTKHDRMPRAVWLFAAYAFFAGAAVQGTNVYLPLFAHESMGLGLTAAGLTAAVAGAIGVVSRIGWGRALAGRTGAFALLVALASGSAMGTLALFGSATLASLPLLWVGVAVHGATALAANVVLMASALRVVPAYVVGRASSRIAVGMYLGFASGPALMGLLFDLAGDFSIGWIVGSGLYAVCVLLCVWGMRSSHDRAGSVVRDVHEREV